MAQRKPDAFLLPPNWEAPDGSTGREKKIGARINAALGGVAQGGRDAHTGYLFARLDATQTRLYPKGHDREGEDRYDWFLAEQAEDRSWSVVGPVRGLDGEERYPLIGYLKDGADAPSPMDDPKVKEAMDRHLEEYRKSPEWKEQLRKLQVEGSQGEAI